MTATATLVSPKRTSGRSTWRAASNARRSSKLGRKTRQTNGNNIFRWYRNGWGRYTQADPVGVGVAGIVLPGPSSLTRWSPKQVERMRSRGFSGATAITGYAYADDTPLRATDPLGLFLWHCIAKAMTPSPTSAPIDPTNFKKGYKKVCVYEVDCEAKDSLFAVPVKIEAFWQRPMPPSPRKCDKYCTFTVLGVPQTYQGQNLFANVSGVYCSDSVQTQSEDAREGS